MCVPCPYWSVALELPETKLWFQTTRDNPRNPPFRSGWLADAAVDQRDANARARVARLPRGKRVHGRSGVAERRRQAFDQC